MRFIMGRFSHRLSEDDVLLIDAEQILHDASITRISYGRLCVSEVAVFHRSIEETWSPLGRVPLFPL